MDAQTVVARDPRVIFTRLDEDLLAIDADAGNCYSLNRHGRAVWELLESPTTVRALCDRLRERFDVDDATCLDDVTDLLRALHAADLLVVENRAG